MPKTTHTFKIGQQVDYTGPTPGAARKVDWPLQGHRHSPAALSHHPVSDQELEPRASGTRKRTEARAGTERIGGIKSPEPLSGPGRSFRCSSAVLMPGPPFSRIQSTGCGVQLPIGS